MPSVRGLDLKQTHLEDKLSAEMKRERNAMKAPNKEIQTALWRKGSRMKEIHELRSKGVHQGKHVRIASTLDEELENVSVKG